MKKINQIWKSICEEIFYEKKEAKLYILMMTTYECSLKMETSQKEES